MPQKSECFLLFRNGSIGNTLIAVPAIRAIRQTFPKAHLCLILDPTGAALLKYCPLIDEIIVYAKFGRHRRFLPNLSFVRQLRQRHPTRAVLFKRFFRNGFLAFLSGAKERIGFETKGSAPFLNRTVPYEEGRDIVELNLELAFLLGADRTASRELELWFDSNVESATERFLRENNLIEKAYTVICLGGRTSPPYYLASEKWRNIVGLAGNADEAVVFLGAGEERTLAEAVTQTANQRSLLAFDLPILLTASLIRRAKLFVGTNSGLAHIANAVRTPGLIFFRPDDNVANEIEKWCPKGPRYRPLVPPVDSSAFPQFLTQVEKAIFEVLA
ncbi:MAG: glycosyltransferase family 9 protein [bacterium]